MAETSHTAAAPGHCGAGAKGKKPDFSVYRRIGAPPAGMARIRIVWGSDWPHVGQTEQMPKTTLLLDLLRDWATPPQDPG